MTKQAEKIWFALEIAVDESASEAIEFALNELGALGTEINNLGKDKPKDILRVFGYFNKKPSDANIQNELSEAVRIYGFTDSAIRETEWRTVENKDWLAEWKKHWRATVTEKFIVAPSWEKIENTEKILLRIEPNMAFGTGTHETTRLCLKAIEESFTGAQSFLDVGTGTGILAIAASKFKPEKSAARKFLACDTDEDSVKIARENAALNDVSDIEFYVGSIGEAIKPFDFVCANLTADVILPLLPMLVAKTKGTLVLSGILVEQENLVTEKLNELRVTDYKIQTDGEWISIIVNVKPNF